MALRKVKSSKIRRNPMILDRMQKESAAIYVPKSFINFVLIVGLVGGLAYFFVMSNCFKVKIITYEGSVSNEAKTEVEKIKGQNIFAVNNFKLSDRIKEVYPQAYNVNVYKGLPDAIKVVVSERTVALIWQTNGKNFLVDKLGIAFREVGDVSTKEEWKKLPIVVDTTNYVIKPGQRLISSRFIDFVSYISDNFTKVEGVKLVKIEVLETSFHPIVVTDLGWKVLMDGNRSPQYQLDDLKKILDKHKAEIKEYVDLRTEGYGYWK